MNYLEQINSFVIIGGVSIQSDSMPRQEILDDLYMYQIDMRVFIKID